MRIVCGPVRKQGRLIPLVVLITLACAAFLFPVLSAAQTGAPVGESMVSAPTQPVITEYSPPPEIAAKAAAYRSALHWHFLVDNLWGLVTLALALVWKLGPKFRNWAEGRSQRRFVQAWIFAPLMLLTLSLLTLPSNIWNQALELRFGRSIQKWGAWWSDWVISQILYLIIGTLLVWILYAVLRRSPRRWWFYFWLASVPLLAVGLFLQPLVVEPLFFKFTPLVEKHPELVAQMEQVIHHGGMEIPRARMFEMNASSKTTELNAYVAGFGASKRAVMWDTTLTKASREEALFVFGHEMGHYVLLHIPQMIGWMALVMLVVFYLCYGLSGRLLQRYGADWDVRQMDDWASLPLLVLVASILMLLGTPAMNAITRYYELEADRYGIEVIHGIVPDANQVAARYFEKSGETNLNETQPSEWVKIWFYDHPTRPERVHFVATYNPWSKGEKGKFVPE